MNFRHGCIGLLLLMFCGCSGDTTSLESQLPAKAISATLESRNLPFCDVERWGPQQTYAGERFNAQKDGSSAFFFQTKCAPAKVMLLFDGQLIETTRHLPTITASFNADSYLQEEGVYGLSFYDPDTRLTFGIGDLHVLPARKPVGFPPGPPRTWPAPESSLIPPTLIAHAGGGYLGERYLNSLEALTHNYALGHRFFELDFNWTRDMHLVAIHDWQQSYGRLFPFADQSVPPDLDAFLQLKMTQNQTQLDLSRLRDWLAAHPDAYIVTDIRGNDLYALQRMKAELGKYHRQIIPQMYHAHTYPDIRALGYEHVIFTLYATSLDTEALIDFILETPLFAVTINPSKPDAARIIAGITDKKFVYVHTFNKLEDLRRYRAMGADGIYTDFMYQNTEGAFVRQ
ncbi:MAG: glycerophosphodiester phosphodiesterase family protein [Dokdonella sp.]